MKPWYQSKTIWTNIIAALIAIVGLFNQDLLTGLGITNPAKFLAIIGTVTTILNVLLRLVTTATIQAPNQTTTTTDASNTTQP